MKTRVAIAAAFGLGLALGVAGTASWAPQASPSPSMTTADILGFDERVRVIVEECVIAGAGTGLASLRCHME